MQPTAAKQYAQDCDDADDDHDDFALIADGGDFHGRTLATVPMSFAVRLHGESVACRRSQVMNAVKVSEKDKFSVCGLAGMRGLLKNASSSLLHHLPVSMDVGKRSGIPDFILLLCFSLGSERLGDDNESINTLAAGRTRQR